MILLGIESSCDETGIAILQQNEKNNSLTILANTVASSLQLHAKTGGIIPEIAAREQIKYIIPLLKDTYKNAFGKTLIPGNTNVPIDAIAVTVGPGLIGSLLVGVETARVLSYIWKKPLIPVNHLYGHIYANWLVAHENTIQFPSIALVVSGGHTDIVLMKNHKQVSVIGGTRDDAAGEAFDKIGRLMNLPYPAGPIISRLAEKGDPKAYSFPRPMLNSDDYDMSFSGLKTAVFREITIISSKGRSASGQKKEKLTEEQLLNLSASVQQAIIDVLVKKTLKAVKKYNAKSLLLGGGVSANKKLRSTLQQKINEQFPKTHFFVPPASLCTDNGAMIAAAAFYKNKSIPWQKITANPELYYN